MAFENIRLAIFHVFVLYSYISQDALEAHNDHYYYSGLLIHTVPFFHTSGVTSDVKLIGTRKLFTRT